MFWSMSLAVGLKCLLTALLWLLVQKTRFGKQKSWYQSVVIGIIFGVAAILSTHIGVDYRDMVLNVRDLAPLAAGLLFTPLAGVIAGFIGGVERLIVGTWFGLGSYTRIACSISTMLAGLLAALCRKALFEGKKPSPMYSFAIAAVMEVFHMLAILLTHGEDVTIAFRVVDICAVPMILFNAVGLMLATVIVSALSGQYKGGVHLLRPAETPVSKRLQLWLLAFVSLVFAATFSFSYAMQTETTLKNAQKAMRTSAQDVNAAVAASQKNLEAATDLLQEQALNVARSIAENVEAAGGVATVHNGELRERAARYGLYEINAIDQTGYIVSSTKDYYVGFNMASGAQSAEFLRLLNGTTPELVQDFQPTAFDSRVSVMYVGVSVSDGFMQIGYDSERIDEFQRLTDPTAAAGNRHLGEDGMVYLFDGSGKILSGADKGRTLTDLGVLAQPEAGSFFFAVIDGAENYCHYTHSGEYALLLCMPQDELYLNRNIFAYETAFAYILLFTVIFVMVYVLVRRIIVRNLDLVNHSLARITSGDLNEVVNVQASAEFASLSQDINLTVSTLKHYISEAENRIKAELEFARAIQQAALPGVFPDREEFDIFATMTAAKEIGGDFYDFFFIDATHLALVIADVSGKGIPAALFMMKSKTLLKSLSESGLSPQAVLETANRKLCEGNDVEMFVTAWLGILDLETGKLCCANAGHEYPALRRGQQGRYELYKDRHGFVLGGLNEAKYSEYELQLQPGDSLFVYTDGVPEATDGNERLFGAERMLEALNAESDLPPAQTLCAVKAGIDHFVGDAPQFDDITMLTLHYKGGHRA